MNSIINFVLIIVCLNSCFAFPADEVLNLPGLNKSDETFRQYSGYLDVGNGRHYHYWFVESQSNPAKDPVVLWLNGGPGASSLIGFWTENGPFRVQKDGKTLVKDPYSWNTLANVLYLESPVRVGYSYDDHEAITTFTDDLTAQDNYLALEQFFRKFPQFSNNSFYMTGESYAGVYIPTLAVKIYEHKSKINLKGIAIGNGALDFHMLWNSMVKLCYTHGLIDTNEYKQLERSCCNCTSNGQVCDFTQKTSEQSNPAEMVRQIFVSNGINAYNIYSDCRPSSLYWRDSHFNRALNKYSGIKSEEFEESSSLLSEHECVSNAFYKYMKQNEVRKALHIPDKLHYWGMDEPPISYLMSFGSMKTQFIELIEKYKIANLIVYNGDIDMVCDFLGDQQFVDELGYKLIHNYKKWTVGGRTAGFVKRYEGISFMTVRNAGHMVPTDQPEAALAILKELIGVSKVD